MAFPLSGFKAMPEKRKSAATALKTVRRAHLWKFHPQIDCKGWNVHKVNRDF
jgi:hypothetical protein